MAFLEQRIAAVPAPDLGTECMMKRCPDRSPIERSFTLPGDARASAPHPSQLHVRGDMALSVTDAAAKKSMGHAIRNDVHRPAAACCPRTASISARRQAIRGCSTSIVALRRRKSGADAATSDDFNGREEPGKFRH
jgi:hypothetical protein